MKHFFFFLFLFFCATSLLAVPMWAEHAAPTSYGRSPHADIKIEQQRRLSDGETVAIENESLERGIFDLAQEGSFESDDGLAIFLDDLEENNTDVENQSSASYQNFYRLAASIFFEEKALLEHSLSSSPAQISLTSADEKEEQTHASLDLYEARSEEGLKADEVSLTQHPAAFQTFSIEGHAISTEGRVPIPAVKSPSHLHVERVHLQRSGRCKKLTYSSLLATTTKTFNKTLARIFHHSCNDEGIKINGVTQYLSAFPASVVERDRETWPAFSFAAPEQSACLEKVFSGVRLALDAKIFTYSNLANYYYQNLAERLETYHTLLMLAQPMINAKDANTFKEACAAFLQFRDALIKSSSPLATSLPEVPSRTSSISLNQVEAQHYYVQLLQLILNELNAREEQERDLAAKTNPEVGSFGLGPMRVRNSGI